jgi:hypothetical protein
MIINQKQVQSVLNLSGKDRYAYFIKMAADQRKVWGLRSEKWALASTDDGTHVFPIWPAREYAELCAVGIWAQQSSAPIDLDLVFDSVIPKLRESKTLVGIFPTPADLGVTPDLEVFERDLKYELSRIE